MQKEQLDVGNIFPTVPLLANMYDEEHVEKEGMVGKKNTQEMLRPTAAPIFLFSVEFCTYGSLRVRPTMIILLQQQTAARFAKKICHFSNLKLLFHILSYHLQATATAHTQ